MDDDAPLNVTQGVSLPLLIRDWVMKEYPGKCCYSLREYHDVELNLITHDQVNTVSSVVISPNAKLTSDPDCAYRITVGMERVEALYYYNMPKYTTQYTAINLDWKDPSFFAVLAQAIGCQCNKKTSR
jgi:hypothetical protein